MTDITALIAALRRDAHVPGVAPATAIQAADALEAQRAEIERLTRDLANAVATGERILGDALRVCGDCGRADGGCDRVVQGDAKLPGNSDHGPTVNISGLEVQNDAPTEIAPPTDDEREIAETLMRSRAYSLADLSPAFRDDIRAMIVEGIAQARRQGPITDAMVEASAERFWLAGHPCEAWPPSNDEPDFLAERYRTAARAALEAAERARTAANDNSRTHCKECREGKHGACDGSMYVEELDVFEACGCAAYDWNGEHTAGGGS